MQAKKSIIRSVSVHIINDYKALPKHTTNGYAKKVVWASPSLDLMLLFSPLGSVLLLCSGALAWSMDSRSSSIKRVLVLFFGDFTSYM